MSLLKFLFASTAVGAIALTAPVVFSAGKMFGKIEERKNIKDENSPAERVPEFMYVSHSTQWSKAADVSNPEETSQSVSIEPPVTSISGS